MDTEIEDLIADAVDAEPDMVGQDDEPSVDVESFDCESPESEEMQILHTHTPDPNNEPAADTAPVRITTPTTTIIHVNDPCATFLESSFPTAPSFFYDSMEKKLSFRKNLHVSQRKKRMIKLVAEHEDFCYLEQVGEEDIFHSCWKCQQGYGRLCDECLTHVQPDRRLLQKVLDLMLSFMRIPITGYEDQRYLVYILKGKNTLEYDSEQCRLELYLNLSGALPLDLTQVLVNLYRIRCNEIIRNTTCTTDCDALADIHSEICIAEHQLNTLLDGLDD